MRCRECAAEVAVTAGVCSGCGAPIGQPPVLAEQIRTDALGDDTEMKAEDATPVRRPDDAPFVNQDDVPERVVLRGRTWWWLTPFLLGAGILFGCTAIDYALNGQCYLLRLRDSYRFCERLFPSDPQYDEVGMSVFATACFVLAPMAIIAAVRATLAGIHADDNGIRIVNLFRTRRLTWDQVREIDFNESGWDATGQNPIEWTLAFRTTTGQSVGSQFPCGDKDGVVGAARTTLLRMQAAALEASESDVGRHSGEPTSVVTDQPKRRSWTVRDWLQLALFGAIIVFTGLPAFLIVVLDDTPIVGAWLTGHVPFWDEVSAFYNWLFSLGS